MNGLETATDTPFTDFDYLSTNEANNTVYRMTRLVLCTDATGTLTGMRSIVTRYAASNMTALSIISMSKIGSVDTTGIICSNLTLDAVNGEYLT